LDHHAVKIAKHKNPLYYDQYERTEKQSDFSVYLVFQRNLA